MLYDSVMISSNMNKKYKIIIVDDDREILTLLRDVLLLDDDNYKVKVFTNLVPALIFLKNHTERFDLIISKVYSNVKYGFELAEIIKKLYSNIKVILTSSFNVNDTILYKNKCDGYLQKPINLDSMRKIVRKCLNNQSKPLETFKSIEMVYFS